MLPTDSLQGKWLRIDLSAAPELTDALTTFLEDMGAGVYQEAVLSGGPSDVPEVVPEVLSGGMTAYVPLERRVESLATLDGFFTLLQGIFPDAEKPTYSVSEIRASDWGEEWKKYFFPLRIGSSIVVKPTWEPYTPIPGDQVIEIDPGMAFGTGHHHSTALCLEAMEELFCNRDRQGWTVLDVGTGTGILGIAAAKLGARRVLALDIDEQAVAIARTNAQLNEVDDILTVTGSPLFELAESFELVVANLTAKPLLELRSTLAHVVAPSGHLIMSGIVEVSAKEIEDAFLCPPFRLRERLKREEWLCYILKRD